MHQTMQDLTSPVLTTSPLCIAPEALIPSTLESQGPEEPRNTEAKPVSEPPMPPGFLRAEADSLLLRPSPQLQLCMCVCFLSASACSCPRAFVPAILSAGNTLPFP